ncbi:hypothetical protein L7F22_031381 [Adiantum nelumboides]|nr:hypothetical protein [Adiantum nelumboides]
MEGLRNETLKKDLHLKACSTFEQVTMEALYLVDNCKAYGEVSEDAESMTSGTSSVKSDTSIKKDPSAAPTTEQMIEEITKRIQQQMKNPVTTYPQMRKCDICGGDHPTPWCTQQPKAPIAIGQVLKWCAMEQKWTNHAIEKCYYNKDYVRGRPYGPPAGPPQPPPPRYQVWPNVNIVAGADKPQPVLSQQPPLPHKNRAMIKYAQPYEAPQPMSNAPMLTYYEEPNESYITEPEQPMYAEEFYQSWEMNEGMAPSSYVAQPSRDQYLVDERTLMFIANQNYKPRGYPNREKQPMEPLPPNQQPIGPCFNYGSPDHWERSCPHKGQRVKIYGFCSDYGIKHILSECPRNLDNKGKTILNKVGVLPSASSRSETKSVVQVNVVTRAQAKELEKEKPMEENARVLVPTENGSLSVRTQRKSWKAKRERMKARRAENQTAIQEELQEVKQQLQQELESKKVEQNNQPRKALSGGLVLVDKVLEPLDALLQQWEARMNNHQTLEQRWLTYPYPEIETKRLEMCKDLIRAAQALMEPNVIRALEQEVLIQKEIEKQWVKEPKPVTRPKPDTNLSLEHRVVPNTTDEAMTMEVMPVPEVEEPWPQSLWETIKNRKDKSATLQSAPIPEVVLNNEFYPGDIQSLYGDAGTEVSMDSKPPSLKTFQSLIGKHKARSKIRIVPSQQRATPKMINSKGLQEMLSTPVTCTITLSELLKISPHLWEEMGKHLETKGIKIPIQTDPPREAKQIGNQQTAQPVPINKVGDYCEGEEGNTTLPVEYNEIKTIAILDSEAEVAIATKQIWEKWGKSALRKTRMKLQLADGYVEKPLGILEQIIVTSCGIDYEHTFAVVDFGKTNNFDIILGRPFMRQLKMIQDWGYDQIYLRHKELVTKINMKDHSYRDVAKTPVQDYDSIVINGNGVPWMQTKAHVWMCGASDNGDLTREECILERSLTDEAYIPEPFTEHLFEPFGWTQTEDEFRDSLSEDLPLLNEDFLMIEADDEQSSESESERKIIPQLEKFYEFSNQKPRKQERYKQKRSRKSKGKQNKPMPLVKDKTAYFRMVKANDCVKDKITGQFAKTQKEVNQKKNKHEKKGIKLNEGWEIGSKMTKTERKSEYNKLKKPLKDVWTTEMETDEDANSDKMDVPSHYKKCNIQDRKIIVQQPMREMKEPRTSYDGLEKAKKIDLAELGEEPKTAYIAINLTEGEEQLLIATLKQYKDIKEKIDKLKEAEFIYEIEHTDWVSPIVVVPKKNGKLRVCVNLKKVNAATIRDNYPLPITDHVIERVAGREAYSFLDGFSRYNQLAIKPKDQHKTAFATEWGIFAYRVKPFGLTNALATFQRLMSHAFKEYLRQFLEIYMDDLCVHSLIRMDHIEHLTKIFEKCRLYWICLNPEKCVFMVRQGKILGHIVSKNKISTDMEKILVIVELPRPLRVKEV